MKLSSFFKHRKLTILERTSTSAVVLAIKKASKQGDYETFKQYLSHAPLDIVVEFSHKYPNSRFIQKYAHEFPKSADAHFLYGNYLVNKAWQVRNNEGQSTTFLRFLNAAHLELCKALRFKPDYLPVFSLLIKIQRGKNNKKHANSIYQQAKKIAPDLMDYHIELMMLLSPKSGGSNKEMASFAQECSQKDSTGILHGLIPIMHFEYWHLLGGKSAKQYFTDRKIKKEIEQAYLEVENAELDETYYQQHQYYIALNYFALLFLLMERKEKAKYIFNCIAGRYTYKPWASMGKEPALTYLDYKNRV